MKTRKIILTVLLMMTGLFTAKAQYYTYPAELALVSQPVMTYMPNAVRLYYDVQNIGDVRYRGDFYVYLEPDNGYYYARKHVNIRPGRIKRIVIDIPLYYFDPSFSYTVMPYYEMGPELFSLTTFEYFEPLHFRWYGARTSPYIVYRPAPLIHAYVRPNCPRFYYDGFRPPYDPNDYWYDPSYRAEPMHHTYNYHRNRSNGYPGASSNQGQGNAPSQAGVSRPNGGNTAGSMSSRAQQPSNPNINNGGHATGRNGSAGNANVNRPRNENSTSSNVSLPGNSSSTNGNGRSSGVSNPRQPNNSGSGNVNSPSNRSTSGNRSGSVGRSGSSSRSSGENRSGSSRSSTRSSNNSRSGSISNSGRGR